MSDLDGPAIANYTKNLAGAIGVKPFVAESPKVLQYSNQSDELQYNIELEPKPKGMLPSTILQFEESKEANRDALMSNAQEGIDYNLEQLIDADAQTKRPEAAADSSATEQKKRKRHAGNYYRKKKEQAAEAQRQ